MRAVGYGLCVALMLGLAGCGDDKTPQLMNLRSSTQGPDEFSVVPTKELVLPEDMAALPEPTPGAANLADPTPEADAIAALGGNPAVVTRGGVGDGALVNHTSRFGRQGDIRSIIASEDLAYRQKNNARLLERVFKVNVYYRAYADQSLDQHAELARWRRAGMKTVGAPPDPRDDE